MFKKNTERILDNSIFNFVSDVCILLGCHILKIWYFVWFLHKDYDIFKKRNEQLK